MDQVGFALCILAVGVRLPEVRHPDGFRRGHDDGGASNMAGNEDLERASAENNLLADGSLARAVATD